MREVKSEQKDVDHGSDKENEVELDDFIVVTASSDSPTISQENVQDNNVSKKGSSTKFFGNHEIAERAIDEDFIKDLIKQVMSDQLRKITSMTRKIWNELNSKYENATTIFALVKQLKEDIDKLKADCKSNPGLDEETLRRQYCTCMVLQALLLDVVFKYRATQIENISITEEAIKKNIAAGNTNLFFECMTLQRYYKRLDDARVAWGDTKGISENQYSIRLALIKEKYVSPKVDEHNARKEQLAQQQIAQLLRASPELKA